MSSEKAWVCTKCNKAKPLCGSHLDGKTEVRSDCWPCATKRKFVLKSVNDPEIPELLTEKITVPPLPIKEMNAAPNKSTMPSGFAFNNSKSDNDANVFQKLMSPRKAEQTSDTSGVPAPSGKETQSSSTEPLEKAWVCTKCNKAKPLAGSHLDGKTKVRSDCWPCATKREFRLVVQAEEKTLKLTEQAKPVTQKAPTEEKKPAATANPFDKIKPNFGMQKTGPTNPFALNAENPKQSSVFSLQPPKATETQTAKKTTEKEQSKPNPFSLNAMKLNTEKSAAKSEASEKVQPNPNLFSFNTMKPSGEKPTTQSKPTDLPLAAPKPSLAKPEAFSESKAPIKVKMPSIPPNFDPFATGKGEKITADNPYFVDYPDRSSLAFTKDTKPEKPYTSIPSSSMPSMLPFSCHAASSAPETVPKARFNALESEVQTLRSELRESRAIIKELQQSMESQARAQKDLKEETHRYLKSVMDGVGTITPFVRQNREVLDDVIQKLNDL